MGRRSLRAAVFAGAVGLLLAGCRVHETSVAETGLAGQYYVVWAEGSDVAEFTMLIESVTAGRLSGDYAAAFKGTDAFGALSGTATDSVRLAFTDASIAGEFRGRDTGEHALHGVLRIRVGSAYLVKELVLLKQKIEE